MDGNDKTSINTRCSSRLGPPSNHSKQILIDHVRYINASANMDLSLSVQTSIFNGVFFVFKALLGLRDKRNLNKIHF